MSRSSHVREPAELASALLDWLGAHQSAMLDAALDLARLESPSSDRPALVRVARVLAERFADAGVLVEWLPTAEAEPNLRLRFGPESPARLQPVLVLGHFDTVWPVGTLASMPIRVEGNRAYGPGLYDMKANLVLFEYALRALVELDLAPARPVVGLLTCDEETGSRSSRDWIEAGARRAACVLVLEAPLADGRLKTARKGVGDYVLGIAGRAAHAGVEPENGVSAIVELAHQVLAIQALADPARGTTLNVGMVQGGTAANIVPPRAQATIDVRVTGPEEAARVDFALRNLAPFLPGATLNVTGGLNRPPMVRTERTALLFARARALGRSLGLELTEGATGGGSDANFTAALGVPTLDGLGCAGAGAHAAHEHIVISSMIERAALLALLLLDPDLVPGRVDS
jgi:glutamate carboxypeptidase